MLFTRLSFDMGNPHIQANSLRYRLNLFVNPQAGFDMDMMLASRAQRFLP